MILKQQKFRKLRNLDPIYNFEKINNLFKNFDTMSFMDIVSNYNILLNNGYNKAFLNQGLRILCSSMPFFIFVVWLQFLL